MELTSSVFKDGGRIPDRYTCMGEDISPELKWRGVPENTASLVLIMDDPDAPAGTFTHWVIFNLKAEANGLSEAIPSTPEFPNGTTQGRNDFDRTGYGGPCPPPGSPHHYNFRLYAIGKMLDLPAGTSKKQVLSAIIGHVLAEAKLTGIYQR